jgi:glycine oxidase
MIDYIIVGNGIAGSCFAEIALQNNKSILVYDNNSQPSSRVAGGMYNPLVLKRFSEVWKAKEQLLFCNIFYALIETKLAVKFDFKIPVYRKFTSIEEQNNWFLAADKPNLESFLSTQLIQNNNENIKAPFGYGKVQQTGYLDVKVFVEEYSKFLEGLGVLNKEAFDYDSVVFEDNCISYNGINAKQIIFAEGFGLHSNPYFNDLPLDGTKGELLLIKSPNLRLNEIINSSVFLIPIGNDLYKVGATYEWKDKTNLPTMEGKQELLDKLNEVITCEYEVLEHFAGVRPTVKDRRPLVGRHNIHNNLYVLNGLGTRGVMLGPFLANQLFQNIENNNPLDAEIDIHRFYKKKS